MSPHKIVLDEASLPTHWYNLNADLPLPAPPLHPGTLQPVGPEDLAPLFPMAMILQEVSGERSDEIPEEVREAYRIWRPTPLDPRRALRAGARSPRRAHLLQVRGRQPVGLAQAEHRRAAGVLQRAGRAQAHRDRDRRRAVGLGARRYAAQLFGLECEVFMVGVCYRQKPYRRMMMETFGGTRASPARRTSRPRPAARRSRPTPTRSARSGSRSPRPSRTRGHRPEAATRSAPCSTTCYAPDRDRPGGQASSWPRRRAAPTS